MKISSRVPLIRKISPGKRSLTLAQTPVANKHNILVYFINKHYILSSIHIYLPYMMILRIYEYPTVHNKKIRM